MGIHERIGVAGAIETDGPAEPAGLDILDGFDVIERATLRLADLDKLDTVLRRGRIAGLAHALLFGSSSGALASPRLETLRRLGVLLRSGTMSLADAEAEQALAAGFSSSQLAVLRAHYGREAAPRN